MDTTLGIVYTPPVRAASSSQLFWNKDVPMDTSILSALTASGWPLISSPPVPQVVLGSPSTLELGIIGIATIAAYWALARRSSHASAQETAADKHHRQPLRKAA
jgi:hypothetical protein